MSSVSFFSPAIYFNLLCVYVCESVVQFGESYLSFHHLGPGADTFQCERGGQRTPCIRLLSSSTTGSWGQISVIRLGA